MKKILYILFATAVSISTHAQKKASKPIDPNKKAVNVVFEKYRQALTDNNGEEAVKYVDSHTINYYTNILGWVKNADSLQIEMLPAIDKLAILSIRQKASREEILSFDGKGLFVYSVVHGLVGKKPFASNTMGNIVVTGKTAKAQLFIFSKPEDFYFQFIKEEEEWKVDMAAIFYASGVKLQNMAKEQGKTETQLVLSIIQRNIKNMVSPAIFKPIN